MIDIVEGAFASPQIDQIFDCRDKIFVGQDPFRRIDVDPEFLVNLVAADASKVIFLGIEKESFEQSAGVGYRRRIAWTKAPVNIFKCLFLVVRWIFSKRLYDCVIVLYVDYFHLVKLECHDLANSRQSQRFERARHRHFTVTDIRGKHLGGQLLFIEFLAQLEVLDVVEKLDDLFVGAVAQRTQERSGEKLSTPLASIEVNVKKISGIKLHFNP